MISKAERFFKFNLDAITASDKNIWGVNTCFQSIECINTVDGIVEETFSLPEEVIISNGETVLIQTYENMIIVIPNDRNIILLFDLYNKCWKIEKIIDEKLNSICLFSDAKVVGGVLFLIPCTYNRIIKYDISKQKLCGDIDFFPKLREVYSVDFFSINPVSWIDDHRIAGTISKDNRIFVFDLKNETVELLSVDDDRSIISSVASTGKSLLVFNKVKSKITRVKYDESSSDKELKLFDNQCRISTLTQELAIIRFVNTNKFMIVDEDLNQVYTNDSNMNAMNDLGFCVLEVFAGFSGDGFVYDKYERILYRFEKDGTVKKNRILTNITDKIENENYRFRKKICSETPLFSLNDFIDIAF